MKLYVEYLFFNSCIITPSNARFAITQDCCINVHAPTATLLLPCHLPMVNCELHMFSSSQVSDAMLAGLD